MQLTSLFLVILALTVAGYYMGRRRAVSASGDSGQRLHSLPSYYGLYTAIWCGIPALAILVAWSILQGPIIEALTVASLPPDMRELPPNRLSLVLNDIRNVASGETAFVQTAGNPAIQAAAEYHNTLQTYSFIALAAAALSAAAAGINLAQRRIVPRMRARNAVERVLRIALIVCSTLAIFTTIGIVLSLLFESLRFFSRVSPLDFIFGTQWSPQTAIREDQVGQSGAFGIVPVFYGTMMITVIAMIVAAPVGLFSAIFLSEYARPRVRAVVKPMMEVLAGIPTVVYGFFAILTVAPWVREFGIALGLNANANSAMTAGLVMGVMIVPFVSSLSDDVINAVPQSLRDGSYGLGATQAETIKRVILPAALPGIVGSLLLAVSRAIGETMIVVMAAGQIANLTANPFEQVTTVTVQIVMLLTGDQEFDSPKTLSAFALALVLFVVTLFLNVAALRVVQKYREKYD